eukprot:7802889-Alexandrium_andersonii.AAC.1
MILGLREAARKIIVVSGYCPHAGHPAEERQAYMDDLAARLAAYGTARPLVLLGDFNARLFHRLDGEAD